MEYVVRLPPREKLMKYGAKSLTDVELLALFLRTGKRGVPVLMLSHQLLVHFGSLRALLSAELVQIRKIGGIGVAKYAELRAITELACRFHSSELAEMDTLNNPHVVRQFLQNELASEEREIFMVLFLDNHNRVIEHHRMFSGTLTHVEVYPREVVRQAIKLNAASVIFAHNHPSGRAEPSRADQLITQRLVESCQFMDIRVLDHLVIGRGETVSFAERGWI